MSTLHSEGSEADPIIRHEVHLGGVVFRSTELHDRARVLHVQDPVSHCTTIVLLQGGAVSTWVVVRRLKRS